MRDGSFTIQFRLVNGSNKPAPLHTEEGVWTHREGRYRTITTTVNGSKMDTSDLQYTDEYEVKSVGESEMTYHDLRLNQTFTSKRVTSEFKLP